MALLTVAHVLLFCCVINLNFIRAENENGQFNEELSDILESLNSNPQKNYNYQVGKIISAQNKVFANNYYYLNFIIHFIIRSLDNLSYWCDSIWKKNLEFDIIARACPILVGNISNDRSTFPSYVICKV